MIRLASCYFEPPSHTRGPEMWPRMAAVLEYSARRNSPGLDISIKRIKQARPVAGRTESIAANTWKLDHWADVVTAAQDGDRIILLDADTFVLNDLAPAFELSFDLAYTLRAPGCALPFNAGVIFLRASDVVRRFMQCWREENRRMATNAGYHLPWFRRFGGINQAALGKVLSDGIAQRLGLHIEGLPCAEWNCEDSTWAAFDPAVTRVVHVKSALRRDVFGVGMAVPAVRHLTRIWRGLEQEMKQGAEAR